MRWATAASRSSRRRSSSACSRTPPARCYRPHLPPGGAIGRHHGGDEAPRRDARRHEGAGRATLLETDGKRYLFSVEAWDEQDKIAEGRHERFVVPDLEKFLARVMKKGASLMPIQINKARDRQGVPAVRRDGRAREDQGVRPGHRRRQPALPRRPSRRRPPRGAIIIAPPTFMTTFRDERPTRRRVPARARHRHLAHPPRRAGVRDASARSSPAETFSAVHACVDVYEKTGRSGPMAFVVRETVVTDDTNEIVATMRAHHGGAALGEIRARLLRRRQGGRRAAAAREGPDQADPAHPLRRRLRRLQPHPPGRRVRPARPAWAASSPTACSRWASWARR